MTQSQEDACLPSTGDVDESLSDTGAGNHCKRLMLFSFYIVYILDSVSLGFSILVFSSYFFSFFKCYR